jgi:hypothetical protein
MTRAIANCNPRPSGPTLGSNPAATLAAEIY